MKRCDAPLLVPSLTCRLRNESERYGASLLEKKKGFAARVIKDYYTMPARLCAHNAKAVLGVVVSDALDKAGQHFLG